MYLKKGDLIHLVAPSRAINREGVESAVNFFESKGLEVSYGKNLFKKHNQFAGTDQERAKDFQSAIDNVDVKAIIAARGGYGAARIIDSIDFSPLQNNFKWLVGYSDFTVFHSHLNKQLQIPSIHATMPINMQKKDDAIVRSNESLTDALFGVELNYALPSHHLNKNECNVSAELVGGNLSILYSLCGSPSDIDTKDKILFIEDLDEYLYHVDRMMVNLKRTGKLNNIKALVVGGMTDMNDNTIPYGKSAEEIVLEQCAGFDFPIFFGLEAGHLDLNQALRLGMKAEIKDNRLILQA